MATAAATATVPTPPDKEKIDKASLRYALTELVGIPGSKYKDEDVVRALKKQRITKWSDFTSFTDEDVESLIVPPLSPGDQSERLNIGQRRLLKILLVMFHVKSRENQGPINILKVTRRHG